MIKIYALANLVINPIALIAMFNHPTSDVSGLILGWIIVSSLANSLARNIVFAAFKMIFTVGLTGVAAFGIIGFFFVAVLAAAAGTLILAGVLVLLWFSAWPLLMAK